MFFVNLFQGEGATFENAAQGDSSIPVKLDERAAKTLAALLQLESFEIAHALSAVFLAGVTAGERAVRGHAHPVTSPPAGQPADRSA